jgi:hypothetical protein
MTETTDVAPVLLTSPDGTVTYSLDSIEQASVLRAQLGPQFGAGAWRIGEAKTPRMAWRAVVCVGIDATEKGMQRGSQFYDTALMPLADESIIAQFDGGEKIVHGWATARPVVNQSDGIGVVQWLHVWGDDDADVARAAKRIGRAREKQLLELYSPQMGVVGVEVSDAAHELPDLPLQTW